MKNRLVSVIIPLYNKEKAIRQTLNSVLNQTYTNFEIVIADDGSTDKSAFIVKELEKSDSRIRYFYKTNGGVSSARNFGLSRANGEWIIFLDADDEMLPTNIEILLNLTNKYKVKLAASNISVKECNGIVRDIELRTDKEMCFKNFIKALLANKTIFASGACIYKKALLGDKPYNETLSRYEDAEFELNLFLGNSVAFTPQVTFIHHGEFAELSKIQNNDKAKDFIFNMEFANKSFWQKVKMGQYINEGCHTYFGGGKCLKEKYGIFYYYKYVYLVVRKYFSAIYKVKSLLGIK